MLPQLDFRQELSGRSRVIYVCILHNSRLSSTMRRRVVEFLLCLEDSDVLKHHMDAVEKSLLATSQIPANSGHALHKGTPRETFIKNFLSQHLSESVAIGTGEVIDSRSRPNERRNQVDIVIFKREYPRLEFGGDIQAFLVESVVATIEVKSTLKKEDVRQAMKSAIAVKSLQPSVNKVFSAGFRPPGIFCFVVAYAGPAKMATVKKWIVEIAAEKDFEYPTMPPSAEERQRIPAPGIDGIYVLGKGFVQFDNFPLGFVTDEMREGHPQTKWAIGTTKSGSLLLLFTLLTVSVSSIAPSCLNPIPYLSEFVLSGIELGV